MTPEQQELMRLICGWLLEQDHDDISGTYLWFLTPEQSFDPVDEDEIAKVREALRKLAEWGQPEDRSYIHRAIE
jgi:hypothetical protein